MVGSIEERKRWAIVGGFIAVAAAVLVMVAGECLALPYRPAAAFSIQSEYAALRSVARPHTQVWRVVPDGGPDGGTLLRFFVETSTSAVPLCEVRLPAPGAGGEILWTGKGGQKRSGSGLLLVSGFPAPCDVLPVGGDARRAYEEKTEAGGRVFSQTYRVSTAAVTMGEARAMGWVRADYPASTGLIMVSVTDEQGRAVVKQLWPANGSWWLYEETPLRRSWLIQ